MCSRLQAEAISDGRLCLDRPPAHCDRQRPVSLHDWLGAHVADTSDSHWESGHFVTACRICGKAMEKLPGLPWKLRKRGAA
jgi:hypothetical protein